MYLIYNCGYNEFVQKISKHTYKKYLFKKNFVTKVDEKDGLEFLKMDSKDVTWCPKDSKLLPPFMKLEDWCKGKEGRLGNKPFKIYKPSEYKKLFLLNKKE